MPKKEYLIIGSDDKWYASCLTSKKMVKEEIAEIKENWASYGVDELPEALYIYEGRQIDKVYLE